MNSNGIIYNPSLATGAITTSTISASSMAIAGYDHVSIPRSEYEKLKDDSKMLYAFIDTGVDDWEKYDEAIALYQER